MKLFTREGRDLVSRAANASMFGDPADITSGQDNGVSAWGFPYTKNPDFMGIALPLQDGGDLEEVAGLILPWRKPMNFDPRTRTVARLWNPKNSRTAYAYVVDKGPSARLARATDLLPAVVRALDLPWNDLYVLDLRLFNVYPE